MSTILNSTTSPALSVPVAPTSDAKPCSAMTIRVYNTLTRQKETLEPVSPGKVGIYLCGPTVYKEAHIGHMVGPVIFDTIKRYLTYCGFEVNWVVNITDVDDKLIDQAKQRGLPMSEVAQEMTQDYLKNLAALGVDQIDHMPKATDNMDEIIRFIEELIDRGYAYAVDGDVFFDVAKDASYGKLSNRTADAQQGEGGEAAAKKRSPSDFALWKAAKKGEPAWDSAWGQGRPGWHIECSAMSRRLLGETFDIHGGGLDLVFPHHENELAQSECCHGKPMVKYWMHNGLMKASTEGAGKLGGRGEREKQQPADRPTTSQASVQVQEQIDDKMGRSKGAGGLAKLIERQGGERIRFFLLRTHYRSAFVLSEEGIEEAGTGLDTFHRFFERYQRMTGESFYGLAPIARRTEGEINSEINSEIDAGHDGLLQEIDRRRTAFLAKMDDDFNTGGAVSDLFEIVRALNKYVDQHSLEETAGRQESYMTAFRRGVATLRELSAILGIFQNPPGSSAGDDEFVGQLMELFIHIRQQARKSKNFETADLIRDGLGKLGVVLEDRKEGTSWRRE